MSLARFALLSVVFVCAGCSTLPTGQGWGEAATAAPGWDRIGESARQAARDPWVWVPLVGAAAFQIDNWDRRASDWAREHTPVFGSQSDAERWSDNLRDASSIVHYATIAVMPSGDTPREWLWNKAKGTLVHVAAVSATANLTSQLKDFTDRTRPNGTAKESFPSGHTSSSAVHTRLASRNFHALELSPAMTQTLDIGLYALTIATSVGTHRSRVALSIGHAGRDGARQFPGLVLQRRVPARGIRSTRRASRERRWRDARVPSPSSFS